jgi:hypothetical protein
MRSLSILDLAFVPEGGTPADALRNTLDLAQHAERWGCRRFWVAEHHNMVGIASAATAVVIGYVAANCQSPAKSSTEVLGLSKSRECRGTRPL